MVWKAFVFSMAAACLSAVAGCHSLTTEADNSNCCPPGPCYGVYREDYGGLLNAPCRGPWGYGPGHCGLAGFAKQMGTEFDALVHCMFSDRWEGGYPYASCGPWVGRWEGCCGCGEVPDPCPCCNAGIAGQPPPYP